MLAQTSRFQGHPLRESSSWDAASNALPGSGSHGAGRVEHNRVRVWQDIRYEYDIHGRMVAKHAGSRSSTQLRWNAEHQLIASSTHRPGVSNQECRYHYDALGRRVAKGDGFALTWFVWDGLRMVQEQRGSHCLTTLYEDAGSHVPLARVEHGCDELEVGAEQVFHFHTDLNGAPEELSSAHGRVVWRARYKTWGNTRLEEWEAAHEQDPARLEPRTQNLRFQGQYLDRETGLHYNTFRYYDPDVGRFISPDPIGLDGGLNLYQYGPNASQWVDPWGLQPTVTGATKSGMSRISSTWRARYGPASMREHHLIPQAMLKQPDFTAQMSKAGINNSTDYVHRQIAQIPHAQHADVHNSGWNSRWESWHQQNPDFTRQDLERQVKQMMRNYNIPKSSRNFAKRYGSGC